MRKNNHNYDTRNNSYFILICKTFFNQKDPECMLVKMYNKSAKELNTINVITKLLQILKRVPK